MNFFKSVLGSPCKIDINLDGHETRETVDVPLGDEKVEKVPLFVEKEPIRGTVVLKLEPSTKKIEHTGIKLTLVGTIKTNSGNLYDFLNVVKELEPAGILTEGKTWNYAFDEVDRPYESYNGVCCALNYYLKVSISRNLNTNINKQIEIWQRNFQPAPDANTSIKMEVGIEDCLHIEFEYNKSKYHLKDVIIGKIYFLLVRLKIKSMNISLIKRETVGSGLDMYNENRTLSKYEIMDGAPVKGEAIPVRLFLGGFELTPTYKDVCNKFSVSYILNLVLVDEDDRRYFKQREIVLWRKPENKANKPKSSKKQFVEEDPKRTVEERDAAVAGAASKKEEAPKKEENQAERE